MALQNLISRRKLYTIMIPLVALGISIPSYFWLRQNDQELKQEASTSQRVILSQREREPMEVMGAYMSRHREIIYQEGDTIGNLVMSNGIFREYDKNGNGKLDPKELDKFFEDNPRSQL